MKGLSSVDNYIEKNPNWKEELILLRGLVKAKNLDETVKWGAPIYTLEGKNIVGIGAFKSYVGLWFFQGALLKDEARKLINAQEGKTKALRQWRFKRLDEINAELISAYLDEAITNQLEGREIRPSLNQPLSLPRELMDSLRGNPATQKAFDQLSLSRKREYAEYIQTARREETRIRRIQKILPMILRGVGLNDKYKS